MSEGTHVAPQSAVKCFTVKVTSQHRMPQYTLGCIHDLRAQKISLRPNSPRERAELTIL